MNERDSLHWCDSGWLLDVNGRIKGQIVFHCHVKSCGVCVSNLEVAVCFAMSWMFCRFYPSCALFGSFDVWFAAVQWVGCELLLFGHGPPHVEACELQCHIVRTESHGKSCTFGSTQHMMAHFQNSSFRFHCLSSVKQNGHELFVNFFLSLVWSSPNWLIDIYKNTRSLGISFKAITMCKMFTWLEHLSNISVPLFVKKCEKSVHCVFSAYSSPCPQVGCGWDISMHCCLTVSFFNNITMGQPTSIFKFFA